MTSSDASPGSPAPAADVRVYWRPGCGFCARLEREIHRHGLAATFVNIWDDPEAAAYVRSVARGNETVPTVVVAGKAMVNPSIDELLTAVGQAAE